MGTLNSGSHKQTETDLEMLIRIGKKFLILLFTLFFFDTIIDFIFLILDIVIEIFHLTIEFIEENIEILMKQLLHTTHHKTETLLVNSFILFSGFLLLKFFINHYSSTKLKRNLKATYLKYQHQQKHNWQTLSVERKIKIILTYTFFCSLLLLITV